YFSDASVFRHGLAVVTLLDEDLKGLLGKDGRYVIRPQKGDMSLSADGIVGLKRKADWEYFYLGRKFLFRSESEVRFSDGMGFFYSNDKYGLISRAGKVLVQPKFDFVYEAKEGLAVVQID